MRTPSAPVARALPALIALLGLAAPRVFGAAPMAPAAGHARLKDIARVEGTGNWHLVGYGLVVGLDRTGDGNKTMFTVQSLASMLRSLSVNVPVDQMKVKNVAAVVVTAEMSPFMRRGSQLDVTVSSLGDASSLVGGELLMAPLRSVDGVIRGWAQGAVSVGGFNVETQGGGQVKQNHVTTGWVPGGGVVDREIQTAADMSHGLAIHLDDPDFTTASNMAHAIDAAIPGAVAKAMDAGTIVVQPATAPAGPEDVVAFIASLEGIEVALDEVARVVINERTGTVVVGADVRLLPAAIAHGNLSVKIVESPEVSQPNPLSKNGQTTVVNNVSTAVENQSGQLISLPAAPTVEDLARALNSLGVTPRDLVAIFQSLKRAGALPADLVTM